jgi:dihydrofolate reductase/thymidylate synthase
MNTKRFNIILATDRLGGIGINNEIPWSFKIDSDFFRNITKQKYILPGINTSANVLIMGRKTWESMGSKSLPSRISIVITTNWEKMASDESCEFCKSYNKTLCNNVIFVPDFYSAYNTASKYIDSDIWVIGGTRIYDTALRHWACGQVYWTHIDGEFKSDTFINMNNYNINWINKFTIPDINQNDSKEYQLTFNMGNPIPNVETKYLELLNDIINNGDRRNTRNGFTYSKFFDTISIDLTKGFPLLTTKKMFWKGIVEELLFFIRGHTNTKLLSDKGIRIWEGNTSREFLDKLGLNYNEGDMGPMYGYQWRHFNKPYPETEENKHIQGIDQLKNIINEIKNDPTSRRLVLTDFNPSQVHQGVLYPCHSLIIQFYVQNRKLSCSMYQRSQDAVLGAPFNIASTSLLLHIIAKLTGLDVGMVNIILGDIHIYEEHLDAVREQLKRTPYDLCQLEIPDFKTLEEVEKSELKDYKLIGYQSHDIIKAKMIA